MITKEGVLLIFNQVYSKNLELTREEYQKCLETKIKKYKISVEVETDIDFETNNIEIRILKNKIILKKLNDKNEKYKKYQLDAEIFSEWHHYAEKFFEEFIYNFFILNGGDVFIKRPYKIRLFCKNKWVPHPSNYVEIYTTKKLSQNDLILNINLLENIYEITSKNTLPQKKRRKIVKVLELLKRGMFLKKEHQFFVESFLCFYRIVEILADEIRSNSNFYQIDFPLSIKEMNKLDLIKGLRTQKMKLFFIIKILNVDKIKVFNENWDAKKLIKLADIRNKLSHTDRMISIEELEAIYKLALIVIKYYIDILVSTLSSLQTSSNTVKQLTKNEGENKNP